MKRRWIALLVLLAVLWPRNSVLAGERSDSRVWSESLAFEGAGPHRLVVDNIWGSVVVRGHAGETVEMVAEETVRARSAELIEQARREVEIDIRRSEGAIELYVDGPFRCGDTEKERHCWNDWHNQYEITYDFDIRVPFATDLEVRTVNDGDIEVLNVRGDFRIHNVNGSIDLVGMAGSGEAVTVNGPVVASFVANPRGDSHFETVNGKIDVSFQPGLSADLDMIARWGELWSEYEVAPLPSRPPVKRTRGSRTIIEIPHGTRVRVDNGGPTHSFETLNGNIYVRKGTSERGDNDA